MLKCDLYSIKKSENDFADLKENFEKIRDDLADMDLEVNNFHAHPLDAKKITKTVVPSLKKDDSADVIIFANALAQADKSNFLQNFYDLVSFQESELSCDEEHAGQTPKIKIHTIKNIANNAVGNSDANSNDNTVDNIKGYCYELNGKIFIILPYASSACVSSQEMIKSAVPKALEILKNRQESFPGGITYIGEKSSDIKASKKKKKKFLSSFIPHRFDKPSTKARKWIVLVAILALLIAIGYLLYYFVIAPMLNNQVNSQLQEIAYNTGDNSNDSDKSGREQDWDALKKINDEIVGWIRIDDTKIDYPVLEHKGDTPSSQYYLNHNYKENWSDYGSIFLDYRSTKSTDSRNVIIHGHNMNDGSMFHELVNYGSLDGNLDYYKDHPVIVFNTPKEDAKWKIISVFKTSTLYAHGEFFNYMQGEFTSDAEFMNFIYNVRIRSLFDIPVMVNEDDQILTLSTCSYEFTNFRTVIVARKVRDGESDKVDTDLATKNSDPVFPDVYYTRNGGTRPTVYTFKKADKKGLINWYDGKGDLEGDETLTATVAANPTEEPSDTSGKKKTKATEPEMITFYTVTFMNYDGSTFETKSVKEGDSISLPSSKPTMPEDEYYTYEFTGWQTDGFDLENVKYSMSIAPIFEAKLKE